MKNLRFTLVLISALHPLLLFAQDPQPSFARIAILRPHDGHTVDFESGYIRHLDWHKQAQDPWTWYGWGVWASERQRWFIYATFGHAATDFDNPVAPAEDEKDNVLNVAPHCEFAGNALYKFLPALSSGDGVPDPLPRIEMIILDLKVGSEEKFEAALSESRAKISGEILWFRLVAGGEVPRYVCFRTANRLSDLLNEKGTQSLPESINSIVTRKTVEILYLKPAMSLGLASPAGK